MFVNLLRNLWSDESGAVLSTEYIMLGSIVAAGGTTGMVALRDSMADECKDFGASIGEIRRSHMPKMKTPAAGQQQPQYQQFQPMPDASVPLYAMSPNGTPVCVNCTALSP